MQLRYAEWSSVLGGPFRFGICRFRYSFKMAILRLYWMDRASPFKRWHSAAIASSSPGVQVQPFFPALFVFPGRGVLSSSSRTTRSGVASRLRFLAFGSSALSERGSSSDSVGGYFPLTFSLFFEPEVEALLEGCEIRLAGACFKRLAIESSWSPKESTGPVDFFWCFSSS